MSFFDVITVVFLLLLSFVIGTIGLCSIGFLNSISGDFLKHLKNIHGDVGLMKDKHNCYQAFTVDGDSIHVSKKDGADLVKAIDKETHSLMVPLNARGDRIGKIQVNDESDNDGVMKTVVRGDLYAYKDTVIYVADYAFDNRYEYAVLKGNDAKRVKELFN